LLYLPLAAGIGSVLAYWQGQALHGTRFMGHVERMIPEGACPGPPDCWIVTASGPCSCPVSSLCESVDPHVDGSLPPAPAAGGRGEVLPAPSSGPWY
jgi:hypothetical protein